MSAVGRGLWSAHRLFWESSIGAYMCASRRPVFNGVSPDARASTREAPERTVTSVMNGTGMPPEGGVDPGRPLKWNDRRLVLVLPTSLATRNAVLWQFIVEGRNVACDRKVGLALMLSRAVGELLIAYRGEHGRASV